MSETESAFPTGDHKGATFRANGMTLRDYFAAKALTAVTAGDHVDGQGDPARHAALAYKYADAMIVERAK